MAAFDTANAPADLNLFINVEEGLNRLLNNQEIYARLLKSFADSNYYDELCHKIDEGDLPAAGNTAHKIKGVAANLSLVRVQEIAAKMEQGLKQGDDQFASDLAELEAAIKNTIRCISVLVQESV